MPTGPIASFAGAMLATFGGRSLWQKHAGRNPLELAVEPALTEDGLAGVGWEQPASEDAAAAGGVSKPAALAIPDPLKRAAPGAKQPEPTAKQPALAVVDVPEPLDPPSSSWPPAYVRTVEPTVAADAVTAEASAAVADVAAVPTAFATPSRELAVEGPEFAGELAEQVAAGYSQYYAPAEPAMSKLEAPDALERIAMWRQNTELPDFASPDFHPAGLAVPLVIVVACLLLWRLIWARWRSRAAVDEEFDFELANKIWEQSSPSPYKYFDFELANKKWEQSQIATPEEVGSSPSPLRRRLSGALAM